MGWVRGEKGSLDGGEGNPSPFARKCSYNLKAVWRRRGITKALLFLADQGVLGTTEKNRLL